MKLTDLEARLLRYEQRRVSDPHIKPAGGAFGDEHEATVLPEVQRLVDADGVAFLCPKCYAANGGPVGTHVVICWFVGKVPDAASPGPGRWTPSGTGLHDLTFVPSIPPRAVSVALEGGCLWHGHIVHGRAE